MTIKKEIQKIMKGVRKGHLPSSEKVVKEAFSELEYTSDKITSEAAEEKFEEILHEVWVKTLEILEKYESNTYTTRITSHLISEYPKIFNNSENIATRDNFRKGVIHLLQNWYPYLREIFLSISNSRKVRGGRDFELHFGGMLDLIGIKYQKKKRAYRVDFMIPSDDVFKSNPTTAAIASAKGTLRERWREVVEELYQMRSPNIFLITADSNVTKGQIEGICKNHRIHLVVWNKVKEKYKDEPLVISFNQWAQKRLPALKQFWPPN
ncbi:MAG: type II restriction endonuclease [Candidatus Hodarchaeota archaeon]